MQIIIDLDGTICTEEKQFSRSMAQPLPGASQKISRLMEEGHTVIIYSARSWQEYEMTRDWLSRNQIPYSQLVMGKPIGDLWIDDRAIRFTSWQQVGEQIDKAAKK
ncbi:MAG TPA: HAD hydrolase family protein [Chitinophagaceae bacterium]|nr:HAD hydrolase family protein [Chitinophagaceae bacterium]